jgi:hypothetical protein
VAAGGALGFGLLPSASAAFEGSLAVDPPRFWRVRASGGVLGSQRVGAGGVAGAQARVALAYGGLTMCPLRLEDAQGRTLDGCAGAWIGALTARGDGFAASHNPTAPFVDIVATTSLSLPVAGPVALRLGAALGVAPRRSHVVYVDAMGVSQDLYVTPVVNAIGDLAVAVRVP